MGLREAWEENASDWLRWAREPGHDSYWRFHRDQFLDVLPPPGLLTVDFGWGEGRLCRQLKALGHRMIGIDASPTMIAAAREADPGGSYLEADAREGSSQRRETAHSLSPAPTWTSSPTKTRSSATAFV